MPLAIPPDLKKITAYIRRAEELDRDAARNPESRLVAYYCRQYAVQQGIPLAASSAAAKTCLTAILETLEQEKTAMQAFTADEAGYLCRLFAQKVFDKADAQDRAGTASKETAKTFYTAATFWQILEQFGSGDNAEAAVEDRKRIVYAKWKATEILKALKEGRTPTPGGYGEEEPALEDDDDDEEVAADAKEQSQSSSEQLSKQDAPIVAPVTDDDADEEVDLPPPPAPESAPAAPIPPPAVPPPSMPPQEEQEQEEEEEQGTEVGLNGVEVEQPPPLPPPAYPGPATATSRSRPPPSSSFDLPPPPVPPPTTTTTVVAPPPAAAPVPPPAAPAPVPPAAANRGGWFSGNKNKNNNNTKLTKTQLADATELTRFALAALEDKNTELAAQRLEKALQALGRR